MNAGGAGAIARRPAAGEDGGSDGVDPGRSACNDDRAAGAAADALNARAFTVGQDMFFGPGQFAPDTSAGQRLIAHETAHTVQQQGGRAGAQRIQRTGKAKAKSTVNDDTDTPPAVVEKLEGKDWSVDFGAPDARRHDHVAEPPTAEVGGALKGATPSDVQPVADSGRALPEEGKAFRLDPVPKRPEGKAYQTWLAYAEKHFSEPAKTALEARLKEQKDAEPLVRGDTKVYVLRSAGKREDSKTMLVGTTAELGDARQHPAADDRAERRRRVVGRRPHPRTPDRRA